MSDAESNISTLSNQGIEEILSRYNRILNMNEYIAEYSTDSSNDEESPPNGRLNVEIKEADLVDPDRPEPSHRYQDTTGFMTPDEEIQDEFYNPAADLYFGVSDNEDTPIPDLHMPEMLRPNRRRHRPSGHTSSRRRDPSRRRHNPDYYPRDTPQEYENRTLNLDCCRHPEREIEGWIKQMKLICQSNVQNLQGIEVLEAYLEFHMTGNVRNWWHSTALLYTETLRAEYARNAPQGVGPAIGAYINSLQNLLINEFVGITALNNQDAVILADQAKAKYILENIKVCDICHWKNFACEFERWFYKLNILEQPALAERFYNKLPPTWAEIMNKKWETERPAHITQGLAGRIRLLQETIEQKCQQSQLDRSLAAFQQRPCCDAALIDIPTQWGCNRPPVAYHKKRRSSKRKKKYRRYVPRYRKYRKHRRSSERRPNRYRRKRNFPRRHDLKEDQNCPRGKRKCRCWICQEEGHYASECRNKDKKPEQNKKLEALYRYNLEPIESDSNPNGNESEYEIEFKEEINFFSEAPDSTWESCTSSDEEWKDF
ncbi:MAG: 64 kDa putative coat protein [Plant associated caulimovirus 1]|nr:MAG: 64 kDa putative coat protein [Plant associated caulimovirus 1]